MRLERYSEADKTRLRLFVKDSNFPVHPSLTVVHTNEGVRFEKDRGEPGKPADRRNKCARWMVDYLWRKGAGTRVDFGSLIDALGDHGFAGVFDPGEKRWSDRQLIDEQSGRSTMRLPRWRTSTNSRSSRASNAALDERSR